MNFFNKILVAVDGSEASLRALFEAIRLSYWVKGSVCAVYVAPPYEGDLRYVGVRDLDALFREPCEKVLNQIKETAERSGAAIEAVCVEGKPWEKILEFSEIRGCDLIVVGIKQIHPLCRALIKGTAEKLVCSCNKDILVIPDNSFLGWNKIIALSDLSVGGGNAAMRGKNIAEEYGGELFTLKADVGRELTHISKAQDADLIILERPPAGGKLKNFFSCKNNIVKRVIYASPCPVLIVKN
jgi:nucleotide-binding universal stress UspA family protein